MEAELTMVKEEIWAKKETLKKQGFDSATINKRKEVAELVSYMLELQDTLDAEQPPAAKSVPAPQAPIDLLAESAPEFDFQSDRINKYLEETILMLRDDCGYAEEEIEEDPDVIDARERLLELKAVGWKVAKFDVKDTRTQKESKGARIKALRKRRAGQLDSHFSNFCEDMTEKSGKDKRKFKKELITRKKSEVLRTRRERSRTADGELASEIDCAQGH